MSEGNTYYTKSNTALAARKEHPEAAYTVYRSMAASATAARRQQPRRPRPLRNNAQGSWRAKPTSRCSRRRPPRRATISKYPNSCVTPEVAEQRRRAWDSQTEKVREQAIVEAVAPKAAKQPTETPKAKQGRSNNDLVDALLKRPGGATVAEIMEATGWLPHTTRVRISNLRKTGAEIVSSKLPGADRVYRLVEPNRRR